MPDHQIQPDACRSEGGVWCGDEQPAPPTKGKLPSACVAAHCPDGYGFKAGCAFHGDCMGDHETQPGSCQAQGGVWCDLSGDVEPSIHLSQDGRGGSF